MFDLDISKMAVIGLVALVVLGPERLPKLARTAGALLGRAQRYINDVKAEVTREIELEDIRKMKTGFEEAASSVHNTIHDTVRQHTSELSQALHGSSDAAPPPGGFTSTLRDTSGDWTRRGKPGNPGSAKALARRRNWRTRQCATPLWFKRASLKRTHVISSAARNAAQGAAHEAHEARVSHSATTLAEQPQDRNEALARPARRPIRFL
jgi:sec-independent protein translocase protein TatB